MKILVLLLTVLSVSLSLSAKNTSYLLTSPDGHLKTTIVTNDNSITYNILFNNDTLLLPSSIGLDLCDAAFLLNKIKTSRRTIDETIASPFTRQATMRDHYNELTLHLSKELSLVFRAYNEGIAYRFVWNGKPIKVTKEIVEYHFPGDWTTSAAYVSNFDSTNHASQYQSSFENQYTTIPLSQLDNRRLCFLPLMVHAPKGLKLCLTESTLSDYPGLYLKSTSTNNSQFSILNFQLSGEHAPLPKRVEQGGHNNLQLLVREREDYIAEMDKDKHFPWRIMMVGTATEIAMNNMSYLLGEHSRLNDISWIKPGKVAWDWWNNWNIGNVSRPDGSNIVTVDFEAGVNNDTYKHYIDFASKYGIEYVILDEGWAVNKQADLFQVVPEIDLPQIVEYARERNVGIILWAGYYAFCGEHDLSGVNATKHMERVCRHYSEMGVKGFKIDFMDRDDQIVTDFYRRAAEMCAKYHLVVDFHGAFKPAGLNRTYPNVLNFEGVFGLEQMKWAPSTVDQMRYDCEIPFIRQAAGPMDYTQGAMINGGRWNYHPCWSEPMSQGTRCHQLALYIILESPLNMLCDSPTNYEREPDYTRFVAEIPTVWDETCVLQGEVGEYIVTARRKGDTWYVGGITNWTARDVDIALPLISLNISKVELYTDGINAHRRGGDYRHETPEALLPVIKIHMAPGGGFVAKITCK